MERSEIVRLGWIKMAEKHIEEMKKEIELLQQVLEMMK